MHSHFELMGERGVHAVAAASRTRCACSTPPRNRWEVYPFGCQLNDMYVDEARHFLACVRGEAAPALRRLGRLQDACSVIEAARRASAERRWVDSLGRAAAPYASASFPPAAGSKGLPGKNLRTARRAVADRPRASPRPARPSASRGSSCRPTSAEIAEEARRHGGEVPFLRPAELACDHAGMVPVLQHAVRWLEAAAGERPDLVVTLQPTSPFRTGADIDATIDEGGRDRRRLGPDAGGGLVPPVLHDDAWRATARSRSSPTRQQVRAPPGCAAVYQPSGAVYVTRHARADGARARCSATTTAASSCGFEASVNIDTEWDFLLAELVLAPAARRSRRSRGREPAVARRLLILGAGGHGRAVADVAARRRLDGRGLHRPRRSIRRPRRRSGPTTTLPRSPRRHRIDGGAGGRRQHRARPPRRASSRAARRSARPRRARASARAVVAVGASGAGSVVFPGVVLGAGVDGRRQRRRSTAARSSSTTAASATTCTLSPGVVLGRRRDVEDGAFLGAGAVVDPGRHASVRGAVVAAGAVVVRDVGGGRRPCSACRPAPASAARAMSATIASAAARWAPARRCSSSPRPA